MKFKYPEARRDTTVEDDFHGTKVADPYRWMEDPDSEETKKFVDDQNAVTVPFLNSLPEREKLHERIKQLWNYPKYSCPAKHGGRYFYHHNTGLQNQSVMYVQDDLHSEPRVFLDPNLLSEKGTTSIKSSAFSEDGEKFAYGLSEKGSDWTTIKFKDVATGEDLPDVLERVKFSCISWTHDGLGIFYNRYNVDSGKTSGTETDSNVNQKLYYHALGTSQEKDVLCAEFPDEPHWMCPAEVSDCGRYMILSIQLGCERVNRLYYCDLDGLEGGITGLLPFVKLVDNFDAEYEYITNQGSVFTFKTNLNAPRYKLINVDFAQPDMELWRDLVAEDSRDVLEWTACVHQSKLVLCYLHDVKSVLHLYDLKTGNRTKTFPLDVGSIVGFSGKKKHEDFFYKFTSFLTPGIIYHCDLSKADIESTVFRQITVPGFDPLLFETKQVFYKSKDGTSVPMFIIHKKDLARDGSHPALLYGYGGFLVSITPYFSVSRIVYALHYGGVAAVANIRGGGEYGEDWHKAGMKENKQNVFDDFQAAAAYLVESGYTTAKRLCIQGGSNGGLLVAACANRQPDLFGCVIGQVGVMDMLRFHKFTIGHAWKSDYGCADEEKFFDVLIKYSPLHTVPGAERAQYPATLLLTADHDDRVVPSHSLKFIAQLQHTRAGLPEQTNPLLIRVDTELGHGAGKPTTKVIEEVTDIFCFMALTCQLEWRE